MGTAFDPLRTIGAAQMDGAQEEATMRLGLVLVLALLASGCSSSSQPQVRREVSRLVSSGMALGEAQTALQSAGFDCDVERGAFVTCSRLRSHKIIASCVQRVNLAVENKKVRRVEVPQPACAGF